MVYGGRDISLYRGFMIIEVHPEYAAAYRNKSYFYSGIASYQGSSKEIVTELINDNDDFGEMSVEDVTELEGG